MMQIKANSEVYRRFWQAAEFADFENGGTDNHNGLPADVAEDDYIGCGVLP